MELIIDCFNVILLQIFALFCFICEIFGLIIFWDTFWCALEGENIDHQKTNLENFVSLFNFLFRSCLCYVTWRETICYDNLFLFLFLFLLTQDLNVELRDFRKVLVKNFCLSNLFILFRKKTKNIFKPKNL